MIRHAKKKKNSKNKKAIGPDKIPAEILGNETT